MSGSVAVRIRQAFQADALFELIAGLVLMGNPLLGPDLRVSGYLVSAVGITALVLAVLLGAAALGKGPMTGRLGALATGNIGSGVLLGALAVAVGALSGAARSFLGVLAVALVALGAGQHWALRHPDARTRRRRATPEELRAAIRSRRD